VTRRVVVTGAGVIAPNGSGVPDFELALRKGRSGIRRHEKMVEAGFASTVAGVPQGVDELAAAAFEEDVLRAMNSSHRYAALAAIEAWRDAKLSVPAPDDPRVDWDSGAVLGTGIGGMDTIGERVVPYTDSGKVRRLGSTAVEQVMASGISARVSGLLALGNQVTTNSSACSTGAEAISIAAERIRRGDAKRMLAGGAESESHCIWAGFDAMRVLCRTHNDNPERASRPMSASAGGFVAAAGGGVLLLESLESALERGAPIRAELVGSAVNCGGHRGGGSMTAPNPEAVQRCIRAALKDARVSPSQVGAINGHLNQVDDRSRPRRGGRDRIRRLRADAAGRLRAPVDQLRGRAPGDRAARGLDPPPDAGDTESRRDRQGGLRLRRRQHLPRVPQVARGVAPSRHTQGRTCEMTHSEIFDKVVAILTPYVKNQEALDAVSEKTHILDELKVNSARLVDVVLEFEDAFDIEIADEDVDSVETVGNAVSLIEAKLGR
jgi:acyl carrier protein